MSQRILIVDDSKNTRGILTFMLQSAGYETEEACDGDEALAKVAAAVPDLVILDAMMPQKNGFEVCAELKQDDRTRKVPVILLTGMPGTDWKQDCPADRFVAKPFKVQDIITAVDELLGQAAREYDTQRLRRDAGWK